MRRRSWLIGLGAAALGAGGAQGDGLRAAPGRGYEETCELARVSDRSAVSSFRCIACHDGSAGAGTEFVMGGGRPGQSMSHPVEIDYASSLLRDPARYRPEHALPPEVPLVQGKVACTSCHDPSSPLSKHVVDPMRLCTTCHIL